MTDCKQSFIATQAPKEGISFPNFWQMIVERKVAVVVMITGLKEKTRRKAEQYWPDSETELLDIGGGITLEHRSTSYQGTYYHRSVQPQPSRELIFSSLRVIAVKRPNKPPIEVSQLQTIKWADLTAPDDTKILRDLVTRAMELNHSDKDPILVHCNAGIGRTGTFIAVFKLVKDYMNRKVRALDVKKTVLEMRGCRMKMVQKKEQYVYIFKCLREEVKSEEGEYYQEL